MGMVVWFNNSIWFITTTQYYFFTPVILMSISDLIIMYFDLWCEVFFSTHFLYVIYYCSKFQLFKICQLVYSPLLFLITLTLCLKKWNYRITVICRPMLSINSIHFKCE